MGFWHEVFKWRVADYLTTIVIVVIAAVVGLTVQPHCRGFDWNDPSINHPRTPDVFPNDTLAAIIILPLVVYVGGELLTRWWRPLEPARTRHHRSSGRWQSALLHMNGWIVVHFYGFGLGFTIVNLAKLYAGRLRPDFIARLADEGFTNDGSFDGALGTGPVCGAAREGRLSFPSGHTGISFSSFLVLSLYLLGLSRQLGRRGNFMVTTVCFVPLLLPFTVGISRTVDYHHNFSDVLAGGVIGAASAVFAVWFLFRASDTGEWTLRSHPVETRDVVPMTADERSRCSARCAFNFCDVCCVSDDDQSEEERESTEDVEGSTWLASRVRVAGQKAPFAYGSHSEDGPVGHQGVTHAVPISAHDHVGGAASTRSTPQDPQDREMQELVMEDTDELSSTEA